MIFPGLGDAALDLTSYAAEVPTHYRAFTEEYTVWLIGRRRGLPAGHTTREMAAEYAAAFDHELGASAILGISMGGCIAQHFAAEFPQYTHRLVIANAAHRISPAGRVIPERWLALAHAQRWREFYFDIGRVTLREFHHTFYQFLGPLFRHSPAVTADFLVSLEACLKHDGRQALTSIPAPTLVVGGAQDIFFPEPLLREAVGLLPNGRLHLIQGSGHGAYELRPADFEDAVLQFLRG